MEVSQIKDRDSFEAWLKDKPKEWAQVLAARIALRVAPIAWSVVALPNKRLAKEHREYLILLTFRACFISIAACKYLADTAANAAARAAGTAYDVSIDTASAAAAVSTAAAAAYAVAGLHRTANEAARAASAAARAADDTAAVWSVIRVDCAWLEAVAEGNYAYSVTQAQAQAQALGIEPLWMKLAAPDRLPTDFKKKFRDFNESELAQTTSFGLITDWYRSVLQGKKGFLTSAEKKIALMPKEDWEGDPVEVMDRVKAIAGWSRDMTRGGDFYLEDEDDLLRPETINQGIGPTFSANDNNELDRLPALPSSEENKNPALSKIFDRVKKRLNSLKAALGNNLSRYYSLLKLSRITKKP